MAPSKLSPYRAKRDFGASPEPRGKRTRRPPSRAPRFVVQEHHARRLHWDLRLEHDGVARSWALPKGVPGDPGRNHLAVQTEDHPLEYLHFEGEIPAGSYGAGTMKIWDSGTYEAEKLEHDKIVAVFRGERMTGRFALFRTKGKDWMIHRMDAPAGAAPQPLPQKLAPMLARPGTLPSDDENWAYEIKWDGVRALCFAEPGSVRLVSRNGNDITARFPELRPLSDALGSHSVVLDGEIVAFDARGRPNFGLLQQRSRAARGPDPARIAYMIFDLLHADGESLLARPYAERRDQLDALRLDGPAWDVPDRHDGDGAALLNAAAEHELEGIVAKRRNSRYEPGRRSPHWLKIKHSSRQEFVVGGWLEGSGRRSGTLGALLLGYHDPGGALRYAGRAGTGFDETELDRLAAKLRRLERRSSPFASPPAPPRGARFCTPRLVVEVSFREWTSGGLLRHPVYEGRRDDKPSAAVVRESPASPPSPSPARGRPRPAQAQPRVALSNPDKVLYPATGFSKLDLLAYYEAIAPVLLPHLRDRALTLKRYPNGVDGQHFYEKRCPPHRPDWVRTARVQSRGKGVIEHCVVDDVDTLRWLANLADLELHVPLATVTAPERPSFVAFDLDPGEPAGLLECCELALVLRERLGCESWPKVSGSKGLQLYVPLGATATFAQTKQFAREIAEALAAERDDVVARQPKRLRGGRVLIDWSQNDPHKTTVCVYSLRATTQPQVSVPLSWEEIEEAVAAASAGALRFSPREALERVRRDGDIFADVLSRKQRLPTARARPVRAAGGRDRSERAPRGR